MQTVDNNHVERLKRQTSDDCSKHEVKDEVTYCGILYITDILRANVYENFTDESQWNVFRLRN